MSKRAKVLSATEAARNFADVIGRVRFRRESFLLTKAGKQVAQIVPVEESRRVTLREFVSTLHSSARLGVREESTFEQDIERARAGATKSGLKDPWESS